MKIRLFFALLASIVVAGCSENMQYGEHVLMSDGSYVTAKFEVVVGPDEFLQPGYGATHSLKITFKLPDRDVIWPGTTPESGLKFGHIFPAAFQMLGSLPVVVIAPIAKEQCSLYGNPPDSIVAYAYEGSGWHRIPSDQISLKWRLNMMGNMNYRFLMHGHTYSQEEMRQSVLVPVDPRDYSKSATLEQEVKRFRKMDLLCSPSGSSSVNEPRDDIGDLQHFNSCKAVPRRELSRKEQCLIAALTARCTRSDDCLVSCLSSPDGALGAICNDGCFFIKRRDPDPPGWSECDTLPSIPSG